MGSRSCESSDWWRLGLTNSRFSPFQNTSLPFNKFEFVVAWLLREAYAPILFARAICDPVIRWRGGDFRLRWGGVVEEVPAPPADDAVKVKL